MIGKITRIAAKHGSRLEVTWDDGRTAIIDLTPTLERFSAVASLREEAEFAQAKVSADGWSVEWPCGVDFGAPQLRRWADEQAEALAHGDRSS